MTIISVHRTWNSSHRFFISSSTRTCPKLRIVQELRLTGNCSTGIENEGVSAVGIDEAPTTEHEGELNGSSDSSSEPDPPSEVVDGTGARNPVPAFNNRSEGKTKHVKYN